MRTTNENVPVGSDASEHAMYQRLGQLTRVLHDALHQLGYDTKLEAAAQSLPDARDRLSYVATLTGQAAERVLSAVERGQADQDALETDARSLAKCWSELGDGDATAEQFSVLAAATRSFVEAVPQRTASTRARLHDIMMAQDFHDLTGQVIKRVATIAQELEANLLALLVETRPADSPPMTQASLSGPAVRLSGDTAANQAEVDQLLESLGF